MLSSSPQSRHLQHKFGSTFIGPVVGLVGLAVLLLANGCGMTNSNTMPQGTTASFAFVTNSGSGTVSAFAVSSTGMLSPVSGGLFTAGAGAEFLAFDSVHKFLFVSNQNDGTVSAFTVTTSTGMLTAVPGSPFATGAR